VKIRRWFLAPALGVALGCATSAPAPVPETTLVSPAELVASLADVANGRNAELAETGLVLKQIVLRLAVAREVSGNGRVSVLVLDAGASRRSETSFTQTFTLQLPPPSRQRTAAPVRALPGVADFVEAAMASAREIVGAAERAGLPQKLREVELVARIVRSDRAEGGVAFRLFTGASVVAGIGGAADETNTVRLVFAAP
jgi:hypothetical protein